jgi:adenylate cyclase
LSTLPDHIVIFFADVSGSTQMYERLGDTTAHDCISRSLQRIIQHATQHHGRLIETIGDEAMITFARPADAVQAACEIQRHFAREPVQGQHYVKVRIGFHFGPIEYDDGHPFGDTVNVAARVAALCEAGRIIATQNSLTECPRSDEYQLRPYQRTRVKGKSEPLVLEEIVWDNEDATSLFNFTQNTMIKAAGLMMDLSYMGNRVSLTTERPSYVIGRGTDCDLIIESALASRKHCRLEFRWGEVYLVDHSTNGTYVRTEVGKRESDGISARLHRRDMPLKGKGKISIGTPVESAIEVCQVEFEIY